jgi:hypothetical protein
MKKSLDTQQVLCDYFQFDEADLAASQLGVFSEKQKKDGKEYKKDSQRSFIVVGLIFIGIGLVILFLLIGLPLSHDSGMDWIDLGNMISPILISLAFLGIGAGSLYSGLKSHADASKHSVQSVKGPINIVEVGRATYFSPYHRRIIYELRIGAKEFNAYNDLPDMMIQGDVYAVYFDNADDEILSVEWISKGQPGRFENLTKG